TGDTGRAAAILRALAATAPVPDVVGQLSALEARLGHDARARELAAAATRGYDAWLAAHPDASADHAARYLPGPGRDPQRAHRLARENLARRRTADALTLALEAALSAGAAADACATAETSLAMPRPTPRLLFQAWRAFVACGAADRAG